MPAIISALDALLERTKADETYPPEANDELDRLGLLNQSATRRGKPLRELLRAGYLPHAYQPGGKGSDWIIPHSRSKQKQVVQLNESR